MKGRNDTTTAKADTGHFENPADAEAAKQVAASLAAGQDPFGDNDNDDGTPMVAAPALAPAQASDAVDGALDDADDTAASEAAAAADADAAAQAAEASRQAANTATQQATPAPAPVPQFKTKSAKELGDAQKALLDEKADAFDKYSVGTMTAAEYNAVDSRVMLGLMSIASENALAQANTQTALQASEQALADVKALAKSQGLIDYETDPDAGTQFDNVVDMLAKDPKAAALPDAEFFSRAHNLVLTMRGHAPPATTGAPAPAPGAKPGKPAPRADMTGPITLRTIPAAATPNTGGGVAEQLGRLNGLDFEEAVGGMSRQQRDAWLDS
jgi:hypothetical protein